MRSVLRVLLLAACVPLAAAGSVRAALPAYSIKPDTAHLQLDIDRALAAGAQDIQLEPGEYRLAKGLKFTNVQNLRLRGSGAVLIMQQLETTLQFDQCQNVTLDGISIDYNPLPFTQGTVTAISDDARNVTFQLHDGYPAIGPDFQKNHLHLFDPVTRLWKRDVPDFYPRKITPGPGRTATVQFESPQSGFAPGDLLCLDIRGRAAAVMTRLCGAMSFSNITIYAAPGLSVAGRFNLDAHSFRNIVIKRGARPDGATEDRLMSASADGINYAYCRRGPILEKCDFSFQGDDSLNVHSAALPILRVESATTLLTARPYAAEPFDSVIAPGDQIRFLAAGSFEVQKQASVQSIKALPSSENFTLSEVTGFFPAASRAKKFTVYRLELTAPVEVKAGEWFDIPAISCPGYQVKESYFHDHRARGLRVMGTQGLIEKNRFERISQAAISIGAEYGYWREAGWVDGITVRENTIRDVGTGLGMSSANAYVPGAIAVFVHTDSAASDIVPGNRKIVIERNTIDGCSVSGIYASGAIQLMVRENTLRRINTRPGDSKQAIQIIHSSAVTLQDNICP